MAGPEQMVKEPQIEALTALTSRSGYDLMQENGQRRYGGPPPNWTGPPPPKGCEVFVGKIPRDCFEDELVPVFENIGEIYELRLMMDFSGSNRGFGFVMYKARNDAKEAIRRLNNYEIRKGKFLGVCKSVDNCRLFVGGIPKTKTRDEVLDEMCRVTEGVVTVILYSSVTDKSKSRGFAFVEYESHRAAAMARRKLIPGNIQIFGQDIAVDWAEPEPDIDEETMSKVTILYVRNLVPNTTEDQLKEMFSMKGHFTIEKVKKLRDFAFVHFKCREEAEEALRSFHGEIVDGAEIEVMWAKPPDKNRMRQVPTAAAMARSQFVNGFSYSPQYIYGSLGANTVGTQFDPGNPYTLIHYPSPMPPATMAPPSMIRNPVNPRMGMRGRGRGAAGLRGNFGYGNRRKAADILLESAQKNNWGEPIYQLNSVNSDLNGREQVQWFLYKVTFPNYQTLFTPTKLTLNVEEAKQIAAEHVLLQCGIPMEEVDLSSNLSSMSITDDSSQLECYNSTCCSLSSNI